MLKKLVDLVLRYQVVVKIMSYSTRFEIMNNLVRMSKLFHQRTCYYQSSFTLALLKNNSFTFLFPVGKRATFHILTTEKTNIKFLNDFKC